jgi:hypothetical protein
LCTMQYRHAASPGSFRHFCLRDLHLSHDVSVRFLLSSGTLRDAALDVGAGVAADVMAA